jgi:hypothetical protein
VKIFYLELFDNNIGPKGASALGASLSYGHNLSLLTLKLDFNQSMGTEGEYSRPQQSVDIIRVYYCRCW